MTELPRNKNDVPRTPVRALSHSDGIDTLVHASQALPAVNIEKESPGRGGLDTRGSLLVTRDFSRLHARRKTCGSRL